MSSETQHPKEKESKTEKKEKRDKQEKKDEIPRPSKDEKDASDPKEKKEDEVQKFLTLEEMKERQFHILVGMPCYGDVIHTGTFKAMLKVFSFAERLGIGISVNTLGAESLIPRARNYFVAETLGHKQYTHLMFIDSDITFVPEALLRLLAADKPVIGGVYPLKSMQFEKMKQVMKADPKVSDIELMQKSLRYAANLSSRAGVQIKVINGLLRIEELATGFMLIKREVLETLSKAHPELKYHNDVVGYDNEHTKGNFYDLFGCVIHPDSRRLLSEDYSFCLKCKQKGIEVWADSSIELVHTGGMNFPGAFWKSLEMKPMKP
jgi:hypothetical protein